VEYLKNITVDLFRIFASRSLNNKQLIKKGGGTVPDETLATLEKDLL